MRHVVWDFNRWRECPCGMESTEPLLDMLRLKQQQKQDEALTARRWKESDMTRRNEVTIDGIKLTRDDVETLERNLASPRDSAWIRNYSFPRHVIEQARREIDKPVEPTTRERVEALCSGDRVLAPRCTFIVTPISKGYRLTSLNDGSYIEYTRDELVTSLACNNYPIEPRVRCGR